MGDNFPSKADVVTATRADLAVILNWLKREYERDGEGFWCNHEIIERACERGDLYVIRQDGEAVAYQVGHYSPDIVNVRQDLRHRGFGAALFEASLDRARRDDVNVLSGECMPTESISFWERLGFKRYYDRYQPQKVLVYRTIERRFDLPAGPRLDVEISFYPERAKYDPSVPPLATHKVLGVERDDGVIELERRVVGARLEEPDRADLVVRIAVGGKELCFDKAKYDGPEAIGVSDDYEGAFYVDRINPAATGQG